MIHRYSPLRRSAPPRKKRPGPPRRGRVVNPLFQHFVRLRGCILRGKHGHICTGQVTFHHIRECGSPKDDTWGIGLCFAGHLHAWSEHSIEHGKAPFEMHWDVSLIEEAQKNREAWEAR